MGVLQHKIILLQDGAAAIIINSEGEKYYFKVELIEIYGDYLEGVKN